MSHFKKYSSLKFKMTHYLITYQNYKFITILQK